MNYDLAIPNPANYNIPTDCKRNIAVDIGANAGLVSVFLSNNFSVVHSYEPIKYLSDMLVKKDIKNIVCFNEAVLDRKGVTTIICHQNKDSGSSTTKDCYDKIIEKKHWTDIQINEVNVVDIETVLNRCGDHIDYLKMDCENGEYLILLNKDLSNIDYIALEVHNQMGEVNFNKLKDWVSITHYGFPIWNNDNQEVILLNKKYKI
jgi:FkbM family methyltransferase